MRPVRRSERGDRRGRDRPEFGGPDGAGSQARAVLQRGRQQGEELFGRDLGSVGAQVPGQREPRQAVGKGVEGACTGTVADEFDQFRVLGGLAVAESTQGARPLVVADAQQSVGHILERRPQIGPGTAQPIQHGHAVGADGLRDYDDRLAQQAVLSLRWLYTVGLATPASVATSCTHAC